MRLHLETAQALHHIEGKVLARYLPWQKIQGPQMFHSSLSYAASVFAVVKQQLNSLFNKCCSGLSYSLERIEYGSYPGAIRMTFRDNPTSGTTGQDDRRIKMTGPSGGSVSRNNPVEPGQPIDLPSLDML
ncbi:RNA helicase [Sarracenia purpurea var. burkii]